MVYFRIYGGEGYSCLFTLSSATVLHLRARKLLLRIDMVEDEMLPIFYLIRAMLRE